MKTIKKIFLFSALTLAAAVPNVVRADAVTDKNIHEAVEKRLPKSTTKAQMSVNELTTILDTLKKELLDIIAKAPKASEYTTLKTALEKLDTKVLMGAITHLKAVLKSMPENTKTLVLSNVPVTVAIFIR